MRQAEQHAVHITADNTDVFSGTKFRKTPPRWATHLRVWVIAEEYDCIVTLKVYDEIIWDACAAPCHAAADTGSADFNLAHALIPLRPGVDPDVDLDVNVTTGLALAVAQYERN